MKISTLEFLKTLYRGNMEQTLQIRSFYDKKNKLETIVTNEKGELRCNKCGEFLPRNRILFNEKFKKPVCYNCLPKTWEFPIKDWQKNLWQLKQKQKHGHGIHLAINGGRQDAQCQEAYAQFFECDDMSFDEQWRVIALKSKVEPSIIVKTKKSLHVYYLLEEGSDIDRFVTIQKKLAHYFGGDAQKQNKSTCMRLPGFQHLKADPVEVEIVKWNPENVYSQDEIELWLPDLPVDKKKYNTSYDGGYVELTGDMYADIFSTVYSHVRGYVEQETPKKIILHCILPEHKDTSASAVIFKDRSHYYCKGCGASYSVLKLADTMGWSDVTSLYKQYIKEELRKRGA